MYLSTHANKMWHCVEFKLVVPRVYIGKEKTCSTSSFCRFLEINPDTTSYGRGMPIIAIIVMANGTGYPCSNPGQVCLRFTLS